MSLAVALAADPMLRTMCRLVASPEAVELLELLQPDAAGEDLFDADLAFRCTEPCFVLLDDLLDVARNDPASMLHARLPVALQAVRTELRGRWYRVWAKLVPVSAGFCEDDELELQRARLAVDRAAALLEVVRAHRRRQSPWLQPPRSRARPMPMRSLASARKRRMVS